MSPYEIGVMLWYYSRCEDHPDYTRQPPVWMNTLDAFIQEGLLDITRDGAMRWRITDRGKAFVDALQRVPLPVQVWVIPPELPS